MCQHLFESRTEIAESVIKIKMQCPIPTDFNLFLYYTKKNADVTFVGRRHIRSALIFGRSVSLTIHALVYTRVLRMESKWHEYKCSKYINRDIRIILRNKCKHLAKNAHLFDIWLRISFLSLSLPCAHTMCMCVCDWVCLCECCFSL